jgi:hypothetical protein
VITEEITNLKKDGRKGRRNKKPGKKRTRQESKYSRYYVMGRMEK